MEFELSDEVCGQDSVMVRAQSYVEKVVTGETLAHLHQGDAAAQKQGFYRRAQATCSA
jgi:hypothetical protein